MWNLDGDSTLLHALSLYNPFGIIASLMSPLSVGGRVVLLERFDTMKVWSHLLGIQINGEYVPRTNIYAGVPTHFENLLKRYKEVFTVSWKLRYFLIYFFTCITYNIVNNLGSPTVLITGKHRIIDRIIILTSNRWFSFVT